MSGIEKILLIGAGFESTRIMKHLESISKDAEVILVDDKKSLSEIARESQAFPIHNYHRASPPEIETIDEGKKRKKPCTRHEYVEAGKKEVSPNIFQTQWHCRHCKKPM